MTEHRIAFLPDGAYFVTDPAEVSSYVLTGKLKDTPYGYMASHVIRRATPDEVEAWRWMTSSGEKENRDERNE